MGKWGQHLGEAIQALLDWAYPPHCYHCGESLTGAADRILCGECRRALGERRITAPMCELCGVPLSGTGGDATRCLRCRTRLPHFERARSLFLYSGPAVDLIKAFKFGGEFTVGPGLLRDAIERNWLPPVPESCELIVPVPLHRKRHRERGYNQAALLATVLSRHREIPHSPRTLKRITHTRRQTTLSRSQRWDNVYGAFRVHRPPDAEHILLVDDVMTTGATVSECARVLKKQSHVERVSALTLARATL